MITLQIAFCPHVPGHGSTHLLLKHALSLEQSEFKTHSGRQPEYASPWNSGKQVHTPSLHCAFEPQGNELHLSPGVSVSSSTIEI